ncbi:MAG: hypothetical protein AB7O50_08525 [Pseudolabrys sp.]
MSDRQLLTGILLVALAARVAAAAVVPDQGALLPDAAIYRQSAAELAATWHMSNPYQMPLYPLLVAVSGPLQLAADIGLSVSIVWLVYALSRELFSGRWPALIAALMAACYPPLIFFAVVGLSETLFIALMLAAFLMWYRARFVAASIFAVVAVLARPIFDVAAPVLLVFFALVIHRMSLAATLRQVAIYIGIYCVMLAPWWLHNYQSYGQFLRLTAGFGTILYAGNNPMNHSGGALMGIDYDINKFSGRGNAIERDKAMRDEALAYIAAHPGRFVELAGLKFVRFWRLWPVNSGYANPAIIAISIVTFLPLVILTVAAIVMARRRLRLLSPILLFGLGYTAIHMILAGTIRYRLPLEPFMLIFSGAAAGALFGQPFTVRMPAPAGASALNPV